MENIQRQLSRRYDKNEQRQYAKGVNVPRSGKYDDHGKVGIANEKDYEKVDAPGNENQQLTRIQEDEKTWQGLVSDRHKGRWPSEKNIAPYPRREQRPVPQQKKENDTPEERKNRIPVGVGQGNEGAGKKGSQSGNSQSGMCPCDDPRCACAGYQQHPKHKVMHWSACYDDSCSTHYNGKKDRGVTPAVSTTGAPQEKKGF